MATMHQIRFRLAQIHPPAVFAGGAYDAPLDPLVEWEWGGGYPLPIPLPPRRLRRLDLGVFAASKSKSVPIFYHRFMVTLLVLRLRPLWGALSASPDP